MKRLIVGLLSVLGLGTAHADPVKLETGQVWTFAEAPSPEARLIIGDVEPFGPDGDVAVSISLTGLPMMETSGGHRVGGTMYHLPFSEETLRPALLELVSENEPMLDGYSEGYATWKEAVENGGAGIFTIPPSAVLTDVIGVVLGSD